MNYLITFRCYGTWLHGDDRGSVDAQHNQVGEPLLQPHTGLQRAMRRSLRGEQMVLDAASRTCVENTIRDVAEHRAWEIQALSVQTNHVHLVVTAEAAPEKVMSDLKAYATRRLREENLVPPATPIWSSHGSTRYLKTSDSLAAACRYVVESQADLSDCP